MNNKKLKFNSLEEQDAFFKDSPIEELRELNNKLKFYFNTKEAGEVEEESAYDSDRLMDYELEELKRMVADDSLTITRKAELTGLDSEEIQLIENNKYKATLEQIVSYCKGLNIKFKDFLPELFK